FRSMSPPPHNSPLCPYTTLFRSQAAERLRDVGGSLGTVFGAELSLDLGAPRPGAATAGPRAVVPDPGGRHLLVLARDPEGYARLDRKSTRLNSSHLVISYAVFCL